MIACRPLGRSWQNTTCSWPAVQISDPGPSASKPTDGSDVTPAVRVVAAFVFMVVVVTHQPSARWRGSRGTGRNPLPGGRPAVSHGLLRLVEGTSRNLSLIRDARRAGWAPVRRSITVRCYLVTVRTRSASCFLLMGDHPSGLFPRQVLARHDVRSRGIRPVHGG